MAAKHSHLPVLLAVAALSTLVGSATRTFLDQSAPIGQSVTYSIAEQNPAGEGRPSQPVRTAGPVH